MNSKPDAHALANSVGELLELAVGQLPAAEREVLLLKSIEGYTNSDVATVLGVSEAEVKAAAEKARSHLAEKLGYSLDPGRKCMPPLLYDLFLDTVLHRMANPSGEESGKGVSPTLRKLFRLSVERVRALITVVTDTLPVPAPTAGSIRPWLKGAAIAPMAIIVVLLVERITPVSHDGKGELKKPNLSSTVDKDAVGGKDEAAKSLPSSPEGFGNVSETESSRPKNSEEENGKETLSDVSGEKEKEGVKR